MIFIVVKHPVRPEYSDDWPSLVEEFSVATRAEPGNICFDWYRSATDPNLWSAVPFRSCSPPSPVLPAVPTRAPLSSQAHH